MIDEGLTVNTSVTVVRDPLGTGLDHPHGTGFPAELTLKSNYPNPFNPSTTIRYSLETSGYVTLQIYDVLGRKIKALVDGIQPAGEGETVWDGTDSNSRQVPSGVYIYVLRAGNKSHSHKMVLAR
jgi:hypothetical protein